MIKKSLDVMKLCISQIKKQNLLAQKKNYVPCNLFSTSSVALIKKLKEAEVTKIREDFLQSEKEKYSNIFGNIDDFELKFERAIDDPEDIKNYQRQKAGVGKTVIQYIKEIKHHLNCNEFEKAVKILEVDMVNDFKPTISYIYDTLISYCGKVGNLKEAYRLYTNFKKRNGKVSGGMYTSLFNACANCSNSLLALEKAEALREFLMNDKNHEANVTNYNAMLKAFGRHGDLKTCFKLMDEVLEKRGKVKSDTYCFLLQACISDKNAGLRHAIITWRKMLQLKIKPSIYEFNLLVRCVRDCSFGDVELIKELLKEIELGNNLMDQKKIITEQHNQNDQSDQNFKDVHVQYVPVNKGQILNQNFNEGTFEVFDAKKNNEELSEKESSKTSKNDSQKIKEYINSSKNDDFNKVIDNSHKTIYIECDVPNLIASKPSPGSLISFKNLTKPHERFLYFGGLKGFLNVMADFKIKPDIKTFTLLLEVIPPNKAAEEEIMSEVHAHGVKFDTGFFNVLIKRRCLRKESYLIQDTLKEMQSNKVSPDLITFGVVALGCTTHERGAELIEAVHNFGFRLNPQIVQNLIRNAYFSEDLIYVKTILDAVKEDEVQVDTKFIGFLNQIIKNEYKRRKANREYISTVT